MEILNFTFKSQLIISTNYLLLSCLNNSSNIKNVHQQLTMFTKPSAILIFTDTGSYRSLTIVLEINNGIHLLANFDYAYLRNRNATQCLCWLWFLQPSKDEIFHPTKIASFDNLQMTEASHLKTCKLKCKTCRQCWKQKRCWETTSWVLYGLIKELEKKHIQFSILFCESQKQKNATVVKHASVMFINFYPTFLYLGNLTAITRLNRMSWWHFRTYCKTYYNRLIF